MGGLVVGQERSDDQHDCQHGSAHTNAQPDPAAHGHANGYANGDGDSYANANTHAVSYSGRGMALPRLFSAGLEVSMWKWILKKVRLKRRKKKPFVPEKLPSKRKVEEK